MMPSYWMAEGLLAVSEGTPDATRAATVYFNAVLCSSLFAVALGWFLSGAVYERAFSDVTSMGGRARKGAGRLIELCSCARCCGWKPQVAVPLVKDFGARISWCAIPRSGRRC